MIRKICRIIPEVIILLFISSKGVGKTCKKGEFLCKLEDFCIPRDFVCDGYEDCLTGDDESKDIAGCCGSRNVTLATLKNRPCSKSCSSDEDCPTGSCLCDDECGKSCINKKSKCFIPASIPHQKSIKIMRRDSDGHMFEVLPPYKFQDYAYYDCEPGYELVPNVSRRCHSKENWTESIKCALSCKRRTTNNCWRECIDDKDCRLNWKCLCDGACGRSCVPVDFIDCGPAPSSPNAVIKHIGSGFDANAHYICKEGYYPASGDNFIRCSGLGLWVGHVLKCEEITCSDPEKSIRDSGGFLDTRRQVRWKVNDTVTFSCRHTHRMLGSEVRTCLPNGQWSGKLTRCDEIISNGRNGKQVCPNPGVPINGKIVGSSFEVGSIVNFECDEGYFMIGESKQECTWLLQWSGGGAPFCADPRYDNIPPHFFDKLSTMVNVNTGINVVAQRSINLQAEENEIYFLLHVEDDQNVELMKIKIEFIFKLMDKLESSASSLTKIGVIVYANNFKTLVDANHKPHLTKNDINSMLRKHLIENFKITQSEVGIGNNIKGAFEYLDINQLVASYQQNNAAIAERHVFLLVDDFQGIENVNSKIRLDLEEKYLQTGWLEFYCITSAKNTIDSKLLNSLKEVASKPENFIYVRDYDQLGNAIDQFIAPEHDFSKCGVAGDVSSVRKLAQVGGAKVIGGHASIKAAWPWQSIICKYHPELHTMYNSLIYLKGGGTLLNDKWVLTAAHLFSIYNGNFAHLFTVTFGMLKRPDKKETLPSNVRVYQAEKIIKHSKFDHEENLNYDFALVKLGKELLNDGTHFIKSTDEEETSIKFNQYIRPVCLPCMKDNCVKDVLKSKNKNGQILLRGNESEEEQCRIELEYLFGKGNGGAVVVGFGSNKTRGQYDFTPLSLSRNLHHVLKRLQNKPQCQRAMNIIHQNLLRMSERNYFVYTDQMMCATNYKESVFEDSCQGDSGGPLLREVYNDITGDSCWVQLGIVSFGFGCAQTYRNSDGRQVMFPGYYANVLEEINWIQRIISGGEEQEKDVDECELGTHNCSSHSTCKNTEGSYTCTCDLGYQANGEVCQDINECTSSGLVKHDCSTNANCVNTVGSYICACKPGYTGDGIICNVIKCPSPTTIDNAHKVKLANKYNFGSILTFTCKRGFNLVGNHEITCTGQGTWTKYPLCEDINECTSIPPRHDCSNNAICTNTIGSYLCNCEDGFIGSGVFCQDRDECSSNQHDCSENAKCRNTEGSYQCTCNSGYVGDGRSCEAITCHPPRNIFNGNRQDFKLSYAIGDVVEYSCLPGFKISDTNEVVCLENGKWSDLPICNAVKCKSPRNVTNAHPIPYFEEYHVKGFARYTCKLGFQISGNSQVTCQTNGEWSGYPTCNDIDECKTSVHKCSDQAHCQNTFGSYTCVCKVGFFGDGTKCQDVNECTRRLHDCSKDAACSNTLGTYSCTCNRGFSGNGKICQVINTTPLIATTRKPSRGDTGDLLRQILPQFGVTLASTKSPKNGKTSSTDAYDLLGDLLNNVQIGISINSPD